MPRYIAKGARIAPRLWMIISGMLAATSKRYYIPVLSTSIDLDTMTSTTVSCLFACLTASLHVIII